MDRIPALAWVGIAIVLIITIGFNYSLISMLRNKPDLKMKRPKRSTADQLQKFGEVLRDPFKEERSQLKELNDLVHQLDSPAPPENEHPTDQKKV